MGRKSDRQIWFHWNPLDKKHVSCSYCDYTIVKHATRCKEHTMLCYKAPMEVRESFRCQPLSTSLRSQDSLVLPNPEAQIMEVICTNTISSSNTNNSIPIETSVNPSQESNVSCESSETSTNRASLGAAVNPVMPKRYFTAASSPPPAKKSKNSTLDGQVNRMTLNKMKELQTLFVKAIIAGNVPFNWLQNHHLLAFFEKLGTGLILPSRKEASGSILDSIEEETNQAVATVLEKEMHVTLQPDGWQNVRNTAVVNIMAGNPNVCTYFKSFETGETSHNTAFIKEKLYEAITALNTDMRLTNQDKVVAIISDQGSGYKQARDAIQHETGGKILSITCAAHLINLLTGDFCKLPSVQNIIIQAKSIVKEIKGSKLKIGEYHTEYTKYIVEQKEHGQSVNRVSLTLPAVTRWYGIRDMFEKLMKSKPVLERMAIRFYGRLSPEIRSKIKDDNLWQKINIVYPVIQLLTDGIRVVERGSSCLSDVVEEIHKLGDIFLPGKPNHHLLTNLLTPAEISKTECQYLKRAADEHVTLYHYLANLLDPRYRGSRFINDADRMLKVVNLMESYAFNLGVAVTPEQKQNIGTQMTAYRNKEDLFSSSMLFHEIPNKYWKNFLLYSSTSLIATIGCRIMSIPATSADVERSFSVQGNVHTKSRNRLTEKSIDKLMRVKWHLSYEAKQKELERAKFKQVRIDATGTTDADFEEEEVDDVDELIYLDPPFTFDELSRENENSNALAVIPGLDD